MELELVYTCKRNKGLSSTFQPSEEGRSVQQPKRCDKHGDKNEDISPKNVNESVCFKVNSIMKKCLMKNFTLFYSPM